MLKEKKKRRIRRDEGREDDERGDEELTGRN